MALIDNLLAYYKLDDLNDSHGAYTLSNSGIYTHVAGKIDNGVELLNTTQRYLYRNDSYGMTYASERSYSLWVKMYSNPTSGTAPAFCILSHFFATNPGNYGFLRYYNNSGTMQLNQIGSGTLAYNVNLGTTWHHIVYTHSHSPNVIKVYLDGVLRLNGANSASSNYSAYVTSLRLGNFNSSYYMNGVTDEVGVWNKILIQAEVDELYNSGNGLTYPFTTPPVVDTSKFFLVF